MITHPFKPIYNENSKILILGSFPSVKSREYNFYYSHPQNRFWKILSKIFNEEKIDTIEQKTNLLLKNNIAIYDVIMKCDIEGSLDSNIKNVKVNDINSIITNSKIEKIFFNGKKAYELFLKYNKNNMNNNKIKLEVLPSTSSANAIWSFDKLYNYWNDKIIDALKS